MLKFLLCLTILFSAYSISSAIPESARPFKFKKENVDPYIIGRHLGLIITGELAKIYFKKVSKFKGVQFFQSLAIKGVNTTTVRGKRISCTFLDIDTTPFVDPNAHSNWSLCKLSHGGVGPDSCGKEPLKAEVKKEYECTLELDNIALRGLAEY